MKYSPSENLFYNQEWTYPLLPDDLIDIDQSEYALLQERRAEGMVIVKGKGGKPVAVMPGPIAVSREETERLRLMAYSDPITGCDRFKAEADAERLSGNEEAAANAEQKLLSRREEIKSQYPWPESK